MGLPGRGAIHETCLSNACVCVFLSVAETVHRPLFPCSRCETERGLSSYCMHVETGGVGGGGGGVGGYSFTGGRVAKQCCLLVPCGCVREVPTKKVPECYQSLLVLYYNFISVR